MAKLDILQQVPRKYKRYGLPEDILRRELQQMPRPDIVLLSSGMIYWYPGVAEMTAKVNELFPDVPVILGDIYAT